MELEKIRGLLAQACEELTAAAMAIEPTTIVEQQRIRLLQRAQERALESSMWLRWYEDAPTQPPVTDAAGSFSAMLAKIEARFTEMMLTLDDKCKTLGIGTPSEDQPASASGT